MPHSSFVRIILNNLCKYLKVLRETKSVINADYYNYMQTCERLKGALWVTAQLLTYVILPHFNTV